MAKTVAKITEKMKIHFFDLKFNFFLLLFFVKFWVLERPANPQSVCSDLLVGAEKTYQSKQKAKRNILSNPGSPLFNPGCWQLEVLTGMEVMTTAWQSTSALPAVMSPKVLKGQP